MSSSVLVIKALTKQYPGKVSPIVVFNSIDLIVGKGEFVSVIGPNGCGKTTLLKIIAGIEKPTTGFVQINQEVETSYMPQHYSLLPWRTVEDNLFLPADIKDIPRKEMAVQVNQMLKQFKLTEFAKAYPRSLSGGMRQKVALIRAVLYNQKLLLLDEPFASLDAITRIEMQLWLLELCKKTGSSVVFVTHDIREAILLSDTIYVVSKRPGVIRQKFIKKNTPNLEKKLLSLLIEK